MIDRAAWLAERRTGVGGSDAAPVLGMSKYKSPLDVYLDKRGEVGDGEDNEAMLWGRVLEAPIRQQYAERTGRIVTVPTKMLRHPVHKFMLANLDGVTDDNRLLEVKTARSGQEWGEVGSDEVPIAYLLQVQHYLSVTAMPVADVAVLIGGSDFRIYEVPADHELQEMIIEAEAAFWQNVQRGVSPDPISFEDMQTLYGKVSRAITVEATPEVLAAVFTLRNAQAVAKLAEKEIEDQKAIVMKLLGNADTLVTDGLPLVTWKQAKAAMRFDAKAFEIAQPDLYAQFLKAGESSRRFVLKS